MQVLNKSARPVAGSQRAQGSRRSSKMPVIRAVAAVEKTLVTTKSDEVMAEARTLFPGGVNSPVRAFRSVGGNPIVFDRVKGPYCWDVDGNKYVDYIGSWGPAIVGAANDEVNEVLRAQLEKGTSFGAPGPLENVLAKMVIDRVPSVEMVRFVSSGTEACLSVLRLMRAYTKREKVLKFVGCYHGHADSFLVKAGSGVATLGLPDSPGVPASTAAATLNATYNDLESVREVFAANKGQIAGVILEPVVGNSGFIVPTKEFLEGLREITKAEGALLCFDEVMTGFRIAKGCAQEHFGITPDLTTMGKVIGGGLPVGAYGGRKDIMELVAPAGPMYQAGTLSGNPLAMAAGIKTLEILGRPGAYEHLDRVTSKLVDGIVAAAKESGHAITAGHISGMFGFFFCDGPITCYEDAAAKADTAKFARFHRAMLEEGVYLAPSQFEAGFTGLQHTDADIEFTIEAARRVLKRI
ncbi:glutamate-1-semialdehyde2,1-aminomutase [Monoraphidium neglectum]|uniref:glutamate-1-semialdehyde 2,1-aminomutase n=1 Tax=Monoraphidium neglectum TaxID=145388 RepID=A0A0D2NHJ0_9CHLO|nr:glutamate-1-semialdehyde2,1-aminomutase [Monoraphidium neglectum]KIZ04471.1 glutamate-1-semialdehyde2,1-aminomutase [Monoraphidium neglectum]|eukprot:XP_013903490.1 glutamate-1-semialdehyde2,1-aminomutase [Monoraphidium neglectum]